MATVSMHRSAAAFCPPAGLEGQTLTEFLIAASEIRREDSVAVIGRNVLDHLLGLANVACRAWSPWN